MIDNCVHIALYSRWDNEIRYLNRGLNPKFTNWVYGKGGYGKLTRTDVRGWNDCYTLGVL